MGIVYWQDLDMDSLIMENKYLADRVAQVETEKELVNQTLQNYKVGLKKWKLVFTFLSIFFIYL